MKKRSVCILFGGISPEHEVSLRSAESVLNHIDHEKYNVFPVGITKEGDWILFGGDDYSMLPGGQWQEHPANRRAAISPVRGQGLLTFEGDCVVREHIDVVFPVLHGENGEDGAMQGLLQMAGIPYVGPHVSASAKILNSLEEKFSYHMFVKPAGTGSSVGVSKATHRESLREALLAASAYDKKILVEEFIDGREVEVAVMGNDSPVASICGEIDSGADFYDYESKYVTDTSTAYIPARIPEDVAEQVRDAAVKVYSAVGCQGLSRVDFFVTYKDNRVVFNEINTLPGFTSISMYPKLFAASGIPYSDLIDELLRLAMEACE